MTPKPPAAFLARVITAIETARRYQSDERKAVALALGVPLVAAGRLIDLVSGRDVPPVPPRTLDR